MEERKIELQVERMFDKLDRKLMSGVISQAEYEKSAELIKKWADFQAKQNRR